MKKTVVILVIAILVVIYLGLMLALSFKAAAKKETSQRIAELPYFSFSTLKNTRFSSSEIKDGPLLIVYFHPECEHCQYEIPEFLGSKIPETFRKVLLVSYANPDSIRKFLDLADFSRYQSVIALVDSSFQFQKIFGSSIIPTSFIYNRRLHLIKAITGEVKSGMILKYLEESEQD